jgi:hypothetical protein
MIMKYFVGDSRRCDRSLLGSVGTFRRTSRTHRLSTILPPIRQSLVFTAVLAIMLLPAGNDAQTVQNPSFETPNVGSGFQYRPSGAGWTFANTYSGVVGCSSDWNCPRPTDGVQSAILQSAEGVNSEISQTISDFTIGEEFVVKFSAAQRCCDPQTQDFKVFIDSTEIGHFQPPGTSFQEFVTESFTATSTTHTLRFVAVNSAGFSINPHGDNTAFIDDVRIEGNNVLQLIDPNPSLLDSAGNIISLARLRLRPTRCRI